MQRLQIELTAALATALILIASVPAWALDGCVVPIPQPGSYIYEALIDIDGNPSTGGSVPVQQSGSQVNIPGIDYIVEAIAYTPGPVGTATPPMGPGLKSLPAPLTPAGPQVYETNVWEWQSTVFDPVICDSSVYPIGPNGIGGSQLVEFEAPLSAFSLPLPGSATVVFHASVASINVNDYTVAVPLRGSVIAIPALGAWGALAFALLLLAAAGWALSRHRREALMAVLAVTLLLGAGSAIWAAGFVMDGQNTDWQGISPIVTDPADDSGGPSGPNHDAAEDILHGFFASDGTNAVFRMDIRGPIPPAPIG